MHAVWLIDKLICACRYLFFNHAAVESSKCSSSSINPKLNHKHTFWQVVDDEFGAYTSKTGMVC